jgi:ABC-type dipeptide/oligopeptide/nickel transport system permease component
VLHVLQLTFRRAALALPTLFGVVLVSFILTRLLPGDPAVYFAGASPTKEAIEDIRKAMLLDRPMWEQFISYIMNLLHGDLG